MVEEALDGTYVQSKRPGRQAMPHQIQALNALNYLEHRAILADDMGLGKTSTALWAFENSGAERLLVVCPASVKFNWEDEVNITLGEDPWLRTMVIHGSRPTRANQLSRLGPNICIAIINYDLLSYLEPTQRTRLQVWIEGGFLILDESHYIKDRNAARSRHARTFKPKQCLLLSGTPVRNTVVDLYNQVEAVAPKTWNSFRDFQRRYCVFRPLTINQGRRTIQQFAGVQNEKELNAVMHTVQIRRKKEDVLNLPEKTHTFPKLTLDDSTRRIYRAMKDWGLVQLEELDPDLNIFNPRAGSAIEVFMRLEQIAQGCIGGIPDPVMSQIATWIGKNGSKIEGRGNEIMLPKSAKVLWLLETIKTLIQTDHRPVIFCRFNATLFWLHQNLEWDSLALHGQVKDKHGVIKDFQEGKAPILLCQVKMAEGFNLTRSQDCIFLGRDWSPAQNRQAEDRLHRIGQRGTVNIQVPVVRGTIDMVLHDRLQTKEDSARVVLAKLTVGELKELLR
jgi:SWI/SNF-related matrix-associated actin-dependent regulator 1 of chromatin subfamily A